MTPLEAARQLQAMYGKPADHPWMECSHQTTQEGGEGCHLFASCHNVYPSRCGFMPHEHHQPDAPELLLPQIVAALESLDQILTVNGPYEPVVDEVEGGHDGPYYMFCHGRTAHGHREPCPWNNAVLARRYGEQR